LIQTSNVCPTAEALVQLRRPLNFDRFLHPFNIWDIIE
jgi:hypothetical protein